MSQGTAATSLQHGIHCNDFRHHECIQMPAMCCHLVMPFLPRAHPRKPKTDELPTLFCNAKGSSEAHFSSSLAQGAAGAISQGALDTQQPSADSSPGPTFLHLSSTSWPTRPVQSESIHQQAPTLRFRMQTIIGGTTLILGSPDRLALIAWPLTL